MKQAKWSLLPSSDIIPKSISGHSIIRIGNKFISYGGGDTFGYHEHALFEYDIIGRQWTHLKNTKGALPNKRDGHSLVHYKNALYLFGGYNGYKCTNDIYKLSLENMEWTILDVKGEKPSEKWGHSAVVYENKMVVFGGESNFNNYPYELHVFNFDTNEWKMIPEDPNEKVPLGRHNHSAIVRGSNMVMFGGYGEHQRMKYRFNDLWFLNLNNFKWTLIDCFGEIPPERSGHVCVMRDIYMYIFAGGYNNIYKNDFYVYNFQTKEWKKIEIVGDVPKRIGFAQAIATEDRMIIFGGYNGETNTHVNDLYEYIFEDTYTTKHLRQCLIRKPFHDLQFNFL